MIFKHQRKKLDSPMKVLPFKSVKYLGIKIDENLIWKQHNDDIAIKLNRANALLSIISPLLRSNHILKLEDKIL